MAAESRPTAIATMDEEAVDVSEDLHPCAVCGRTFLPAPLQKHMRVCEKSVVKKRKVFNSLKQRVEGTDLAPFHQRSYRKKHDTLAEKQEPPPRQSNWKQKHLELVNAIRVAKGAPETMSGPKRPSLGNPTSEKCPSCDRHFGPKAFDRHVEWCKERKSTIHKSPASVQMAKERLEARTKYKVPPLNKSKRAATRDKYSPQTSQTDSTSNMKSTSACTLDRGAGARKSKTVINKKSVEAVHDYTSQDEYQDRYKRDAGDVFKKQVAGDRTSKESNKNDAMRSQRSKPSKNNQTKINKITVNDSILGLTVSPMISVDDSEAKKMTTWKDTVRRTKKVTPHTSTSLLMPTRADSIQEEPPPKMQTFSKLSESKSESNTAENFKLKVVVKEKIMGNQYSQIHSKSKLPIPVHYSLSSPSVVNVDMPSLISPASSIEDCYSMANLGGSRIPTKMPKIRKKMLYDRNSATREDHSSIVSPTISPLNITPRHDKAPFKIKDVRRTSIQSPKPTKTPRREPIGLKQSPKQYSFDVIITPRKLQNGSPKIYDKLVMVEADESSDDGIGTIFLDETNSNSSAFKKGKITLDDFEGNTAMQDLKPGSSGNTSNGDKNEVEVEDQNDYLTTYCDNQIESLKATLLGMEKTSVVLEESPREILVFSDSDQDSEDPVIPSLDSPETKTAQLVNTGDIGVNFVMQKTGKHKELFCERFLEKNKLLRAGLSSGDEEDKEANAYQEFVEINDFSEEEQQPNFAETRSSEDQKYKDESREKLSLPIHDSEKNKLHRAELSSGDEEDKKADAYPEFVEINDLSEEEQQSNFAETRSSEDQKYKGKSGGKLPIPIHDSNEYERLKLSIDDISKKIDNQGREEIGTLKLDYHEVNTDNSMTIGSKSYAIPENVEFCYLANVSMEGGDCEFRNVDDIRKELQEIKECMEKGVYASARIDAGMQTDKIEGNTKVDDESICIGDINSDHEINDKEDTQKGFGNPDEIVEKSCEVPTMNDFKTFPIPTYKSDDKVVKFRTGKIEGNTRVDDEFILIDGINSDHEMNYKENTQKGFGDPDEIAEESCEVSTMNNLKTFPIPAYKSDDKVVKFETGKIEGNTKVDDEFMLIDDMNCDHEINDKENTQKGFGNPDEIAEESCDVPTMNYLKTFPIPAYKSDDKLVKFRTGKIEGNTKVDDEFILIDGINSDHEINHKENIQTGFGDPDEIAEESCEVSTMNDLKTFTIPAYKSGDKIVKFRTGKIEDNRKVDDEHVLIDGINSDHEINYKEDTQKGFGDPVEIAEESCEVPTMNDLNTFSIPACRSDDKIVKFRTGKIEGNTKVDDELILIDGINSDHEINYKENTQKGFRDLDEIAKKSCEVPTMNDFKTFPIPAYKSGDKIVKFRTGKIESNTKVDDESICIGDINSDHEINYKENTQKGFGDPDEIAEESCEVPTMNNLKTFTIPAYKSGDKIVKFRTGKIEDNRKVDDELVLIDGINSDHEINYKENTQKGFGNPAEESCKVLTTTDLKTFTIPTNKTGDEVPKFRDEVPPENPPKNKGVNSLFGFENCADAIGLQNKIGNMNLEPDRCKHLHETNELEDLGQSKLKGSTIYWKHLGGDNFSETESVVDGCVGDHSHALSVARIERQVRNCCSDLCLQKTSDTSFVSFTEVDLHKHCSHPNTTIPDRENALTTDEILEIAGAQFIADTSHINNRRGSLVRIPGTPKVPSDLNFDIPNKRRKIGDTGESWFDLKKNILQIKERKRDCADSEESSAEDLRSLVARAEDVLNSKVSENFPSEESVGFTELSTINEISSGASSKICDDLKCGLKSFVHDRPKSAFSEISPRFLHILERVLNTDGTVTPREVYSDSDDDLITISKKHCKRMLYMDGNRLSSVLESQPLRLPKIQQRRLSEKRAQSPELFCLPLISCANSVDSFKPAYCNRPPITKSASLPQIARADHLVELVPKSLSSDHYDPFVSAEKQFMELLECDEFKPFTAKTQTVTTQRPHTTDSTKAKSKSPSPAPTKKITKTDRSSSNKVLHNNINNTKRASVIDPPADFRDRLSMLNDNFELIENLINETYTKNINNKNHNLYAKTDNESFSLNAILQRRKYSDDLSAIDPRLINENDDLSIPDHFNDQDSSPTSTTTLNCYDNTGYIDQFSEHFESKVEPGRTTEIKLKQSISMLDDVSNSFLEDKQLDEFLITLKNPTDELVVEDKIKPVKKVPKLSKLPKTISINSSAGMAGRKDEKKKNLQSLKRSMSLLDPVQKPKPVRSKQDVQNYFNEQDQRSPTNILSPIEIPRNDSDMTPTDDLFSVDDAMYEEYKMFEEMYLKEKEEKLRKEEPRIGDGRPGVQTGSEDDDSQQNKAAKVSGDSAYGSLNRRAPKARARTTKLSPLESQKSLVVDSPCSSSSESSPVPLSSALKMSKYCHECGNRYPLAAAKFCVECGVKRLVL